MWNDQRYRLYRNPARGIIAGVCAGIADYFGIEPVLVRLSFCLALFLGFVPALLAYVVLAFALKKRPPALYASGEEEAFWRGVVNAPEDTLHGLRRRFADLDARLAAMERPVVSGEVDLRRKFRDLGA
jgi:phage shock protein C